MISDNYANKGGQMGRVTDYRLTGLLSPKHAALLLSCTTNTIRVWCNNGTISSIKLPGTNERRIPATEMVRVLESLGIKSPEDLILAASIYSSRYKNLSDQKNNLSTVNFPVYIEPTRQI